MKILSDCNDLLLMERNSTFPYHSSVTQSSFRINFIKHESENLVEFLAFLSFCVCVGLILSFCSFNKPSSRAFIRFPFNHTFESLWCLPRLLPDATRDSSFPPIPANYYSICNLICCGPRHHLALICILRRSQWRSEIFTRDIYARVASYLRAYLHTWSPLYSECLGY